MNLLNLKKARRFLALGTLTLVLSACGATQTLTLNKSYDGPVPGAVPAPSAVALDIHIANQKGEPYPDNSLAVSAYRDIASDALRKTGHSVSADAPVVIKVNLKADQDENIVAVNAANLRNFAMGALTLGMSCDQMNHVVSAVGSVSLAKDGTETILTDTPLKGEDTSCFSKLNVSWLAKQQEVTARLYERTVTTHIATWLPDTLNF